MARDAQCTEISAKLKAMFQDAWLSEAARASGWRRRLRKVPPVGMFWTLACGFGSGRDRTISSVRRALEQQLGITLEESSFYGRFTPGLVKFLRLAVARGMQQVRASVESMDRTRAGFFRDIVSIDSTVPRLHDALAPKMPRMGWAEARNRRGLSHRRHPESGDALLARVRHEHRGGASRSG